MNILVLIISRGRPTELITTISSLRRLASDRHQVCYVLRRDNDDKETAAVLPLIQEWLTKDICAERPITLGAAINSAVIETNITWDILNVVPDDIQPLSVGWDHHLALAASRDHAGSWLELSDPANPTLPFITFHWYSRIGRAFPEYFPFWWNDTWIAEVFAFAYDRQIPILKELPWFGRRGKTTNMRDIEFWLDLWSKTRQERISEAVRLASGLPMSNLQKWSAIFEKNDEWLKANCLRLQASLGDPREPSPQYLEAKSRAAAFIGANT